MSDIANYFAVALKWALRIRGERDRLAVRVGIDPSYVSNLSGGRRMGSEKMRRAISAALGYTYEDMLSLGQWILEGKDPSRFAELQGIAREGLSWGKTKSAAAGGLTVRGNVTAGPEIIGGIPLISFVQAGGWSGIVDNFQPGDAEEWLPRMTGVGPRSFALRVSGTSMAPDYQPGDIIVVDPDCRYNNGSLVVARLNGDNEATFKRLVIDGGSTFLEPINQRYQPLDITGRDVTICGVVRQMVRNVQ